MLKKQPFYQSGFTLIELSIVLVIVGLIVGGVLVGRDLISAAGVRSQISQIEKYQQAANTFRGKYGYLPGDIPNPDAINFGFASRGTNTGQGDGNGIMGSYNGSSSGIGVTGENAMFWVDLSVARLADTGLNTATPTATTLAYTTPGQYLPVAVIGGGNFINIWSGGSGSSPQYVGMNFFGISRVSSISSAGQISATEGLTVMQAYNIDRKIDDGLPLLGRVISAYVTAACYWSYLSPTNPNCSVTEVAMPARVADTSHCSDNNNVSTGRQQYTMDNATRTNCALAIRFQ